MLRHVTVALLVAHGLIHLLGFASAFGVGKAPTFHKAVSPAAGIAWLLVGALFVLAAALAMARVRGWAIPAAIALVASQTLIVAWWQDARFGTIANALLLAPVLVGLASIAPGSSGARFRALADEGFARSSRTSLVTEADLAPLPPAVQRYLRFVGVVGKPRVVNFVASFRGTIASSRNAPLMPFTAQQASFFDRPTRLFFIESSRAGVPFEALHACVGADATMRVKVASLVTVVDAHGPEMNRSETVTMFNDMCLLAPATLVDPAIAWEALPDGRVKATFENAGNRIAAVLTFAPTGELTGFESNDRSQSSDGKTYLRYPWSTPVRRYRDFHGLKLASEGEAIWREPGGDFTYAHLEIVDVRTNVDRL